MFGMGFTEILIVAVIAILFLGPDKLPSAMVEVAKFFRSVKKTIGTVKDSLEEEMNVADIKEEALAYKKELLNASNDLKRVTDVSQVGASLTNLSDDILGDDLEPKAKKEPVKPEKVTFEKKETTNKIEKEETKNV
ncbi:Sec-independent protein translocase protein TatB [Sulfurimonas sp.]|uniref:Sec-independent protein translocase protein TatB n=1 Tax=Sulfurimonas sp. TaxID=2022749 RepID=UPI0025DF093F|nr:Sec-independent protein translocase protein TatB [Sulfurimonas sp.]